MVATRIAHYEIVEKLGEGGMGAVYKARDTHLDRFVALKLIRADAGADPVRYSRFVQEAKAASALSHPGIVAVHDINEQDGAPYIVMEYLPGKSLDALIPRNGMRLSEALNIGAQIASALAAAHEAGIVHRDLKPANVMVSGKGQVKLVDFGLAKLAGRQALAAGDETLTKPLTSENTIVGTAHYMSPEQAQGLPVDARSDIFSFGAVLYEMVTGRRAFQGSSAAATLGAVIHNEPEPLPSDTPHDLAKIVARCLRKEPDRRFQHMDDVKIALEELKEDSDSGRLDVAAIAAPGWFPKRRWLAALTLAAAVLIAVPAWYLSRSRSRPPAPPTSVPLTTYPGQEAQATFSPDGNQIAFAWNGPAEDNWDIYVRLIAEEAPRRLTSDPARDLGPAWSPDGNYIAFLRVFPDRGDVIVIPSIGGPERKVGEVHSLTGAIYRPLTWSRAGAGLVVVDKPSPAEPYALFWIPPTGAEKVRITRPPPGSWGDRDPSISPDGHTLVFDRATSDNLSEMYRMTVSADLVRRDQEQRLTGLNRYSITPAFTVDGRDIVFASAAEGYWTPLWRLNLAKPESPQRLAYVAEGSWQPAISAAGNRLVYTQSQYDNNIWTADLVDGGQKVANPRALIASTRSDRDGAFSPGGRKIAFESTRSGTSEVWVCERDGSNAYRLTSLGATRSSAPTWSPDGRLIAFTADVGRNQDIFTVGSEGGGTRRITNDAAPDIEPQWSADGRSLYFRSSRGGAWKTWRISLAGGSLEEVDHPDGRVSADRETTYFKKDGRLWQAPTGGGPAAQVFDAPVDGAFCVSAQGIYFIGRQAPQNPLSIAYYEFSTRKIRVLIESPKLTPARIELSPDQRSILYNQQDRNMWDLMLVEHFR